MQSCSSRESVIATYTKYNQYDQILIKLSSTELRLDCTDNTMLLAVWDATNSPNPQATETIARAKHAFESAKTEFEALRGKPEGRARAADGQQKQQIARQKMDRLRAELTVLTDQAA